MSDFMPIAEFVEQWRKEHPISDDKLAEIRAQVRYDLANRRFLVRDITPPIYDRHYYDFVESLE